MLCPRTRLLVAGWLCLVLAACGGKSAPDAQGPPPQYQYGQPNNVPGAVPAYPSTPGGEPPPPPAPQPFQPVPKSVVPDRNLSTVDDALISFGADEQLLSMYLDQQAAEMAQGRSACDRVCAALGSMRRSVDAICSLAGEQDNRCDRARGRLEGAERRVAASGCSCG